MSSAYPKHSLSPTKWHGAFTLVELMVSMAVLAIVLVLLFRIVAAVTQTWQRGGALAETQRTARTMLDLIDRDLQAAIESPALPSFTPGRMVFFATRPSFAGADAESRRLVCVEYRMRADGIGLERREFDLSAWDSTPDNAPLGGEKVPALEMTDVTAAKNVVGFYFDFLMPNGTYQPVEEEENPDISGVRVGLAILDQLALQQLGDSGMRASLTEVISGVHPNPGISSTWKQLFDQSNWSANEALYPPRVREGLRFFERTFPVAKTTE